MRNFISVTKLSAVLMSFALVLPVGAGAGSCENLVDLEEELRNQSALSLLASERNHAERERDLNNLINYHRDDHRHLDPLQSAALRRSDSAFDELKELYDVLDKSGALSFADALSRDIFDAQNPGVRTRLPVSGDFAAEYKKRADEWQKYAEGILEGNQKAQTPQNVLNAAHDPRVLIPALNSASLSDNNKHYFKLLQAGNYSQNFMNQGIVLLRASALRQLDAHTRYALDEMQEESDLESAFEMGISTWTVQSAGVQGY